MARICLNFDDILSSKLHRCIQDLVDNSITEISISENQIGNYLLTTLLSTDCAIALAESLKVNTSITEISISENQIGKEGAIALAKALVKALKINNSIAEISISENQIGKEGAIALSGALISNASLKALDIPSNQIGKKGIIALAKALKVNNSLRLLDIYSYKIGQEGLIVLAEFLKFNTSLQELIFDNEFTGNKLEIEMDKLLDRNIKINNNRKDRNVLNLTGLLLESTGFDIYLTECICNYYDWIGV